MRAAIKGLKQNGVRIFNTSGRSSGLSAVMAGVCLLFLAQVVSGQEALRLSLAGDVAAARQKQANATIGYYNLLLGPTSWRFSSGLGMEFNDNVRLQQHGESDVILRPNLNTQLHWPVTEKNSLDLSLGLGYSEYLQHADLSQFFITPGSGVSFDVYAGDFKFNVHDRINITENSYENSGAANNRNLVTLQNTAGVGALWDLNKMIVNAGYDHADYSSLSDNQQSQPNSSSENLFINSGVRVRPELLIGLEAGGTVINYDQKTQTNTLQIPNATQWNAGGFASVQVSDYISVRLDGGYTVYTPDSSSTNLVAQNATGLYFTFSLAHRVNRFLNYTLTAGRSTDLSLFGQVQTYYFVRVNPNWTILNKYTLSTPLWWQEGTSVYGTAGGHNNNDYDQFGAGITLGRSLSKKLSGSIGYQFVKETSSQAGLNYIVNIVSLNFAYQF